MLIPKVDAFSFINPSIAQQGMLVYLTIANTFGGNPKAAGFYYWDFGTTDWIAISSAANGDHDWYEVGTTLAPNAITDSMFHTGNVAIGKNTTSFPLEIENIAFDNTVKTNSIFSTSTGFPKYAFNNLISGSTNDDTYAIYNEITKTGTSFNTGIYNKINNPTSNGNEGIYNSIISSNAARADGVYNSVNSLDGLAVGTNNFADSSGIGDSIGTNNVINSNGSGSQYGVSNTLNNSGSGIRYANYNIINGTGNGAQYGTYNSIISTGNGNKIGTTNLLSASGSGFHYGVFNNIYGSGAGPLYGNYTAITNNGGGNHWGSNIILNNLSLTGNRVGYFIDILNNGTGVSTGFSSVLSGTGASVQTGQFNSITNTGVGIHYGVQNSLSGTASGNQFGMQTTISNSGNGTQFGVSNSLTGNGFGNHHGFAATLSGSGTGVQYGALLTIDNTGNSQHTTISNVLSGNGNGDKTGTRTTISSTGTGIHYGNYNILNGGGTNSHYGIYNTMAGNGTGNQFGILNDMSNTSNGNHYGTYNSLTSAGTGIKYGDYNIIQTTAGGTHYGVYSEVLKLGATNFAGYFLGNVGIGTTIANTYTFPPSRGTVGQTMRTDGAGNVTWANNSDYAWSLNGNAALATDFIGTTNAQPFRMFTNNLERINIATTGNVGINIAPSAYKLDVASIAGDAIFGHSTNVGGVLGFETNITAGTAGTLQGAGVYASNPTAGYTSLYSQSTGAATVAANINFSNVWIASYNLVDNPSATFNPPSLYGQLNVTNATLGGNQAALRGYSSRGTTAGNPGFTVGVQATSDAQNQDSFAVLGQAFTNSATRAGGYFESNTYPGVNQAFAYVATTVGGIARKITGTAAVSEIVPTENHGRITLTCPESPEYWYQDYGTVELINGKATIVLDPILVDIIVVDDDNPIRVTCTPIAMPYFNGITIMSQTKNSVEILELNGGNHSGKLQYQLVLRPKTGFGEGRFPQAPGPAYLKSDREPLSAKAKNQPLDGRKIFYWPSDHQVYKYNPEDYVEIGDVIPAGPNAGKVKLGNGKYGNGLPPENPQAKR
jgi:hypothetical protein